MWNRWKKWTGPVVIVIAAIFMEGILGFQYHHSRNLLEKELEHSSLMDLITSSLKIKDVLSNAAVAVSSGLYQVEKHLDDPEYMSGLLYDLVQSDEDDLDGAFICFKPNYYPSKGYWFEPYARYVGDTIEVVQMGSPEHDYTQREFYLSAMRDDTIEWSEPYMDEDGARAQVITYALPIRDENGIIGVIGGDMITSWIGGIVNEVHPHPSSFSVVLTQSGTLLAAPPDSLVSDALVEKIVGMYNDSNVVREQVGEARITRYRFYDEEKGEYGRVYYRQKTLEPYWQIMLVCYDKDAFGGLDTLRLSMFVLAVIGLAILSMIVWLFIRENRKRQTMELNQERIESELRIAKDIQMRMLPGNDIDGQRSSGHVRQDVDISASLIPAKEVGGDLYDYFRKEDDLFFIIGDVSGKGVPAAMFMSATVNLFRSAVQRLQSPKAIMEEMNHVLSENNPRMMFVTAFIGRLHIPTGGLLYCNAGHCVPMIVGSRKTASPKAESLPIEPNIPLGFEGKFRFLEQGVLLSEGDAIVLYTDGITEARNEQRVMLGMKRWTNIVEKGNGQVESLLGEVKTFIGTAQQTDDITLLTIRKTSAMEPLYMRVENRIDRWPLMRAALHDYGLCTGMEPKALKKTEVAIEEAVANIVNYSQAEWMEMNVECRKPKAFSVTLRDNGLAFDPTRQAAVDTEQAAAERQIGGLGIELLRKIADEMQYSRTDGINILTIIKHI